jgi:hypothetical protein
MIRAIREHRGLVSLVAQSLGASRTTILKRAAQSSEVREELAFQRGLLVDRAEGKLAEAVENGEGWAIQFTLRTLGRSRGYGDHVTVTPAMIEQEAGRIALEKNLDPADIIARAREIVIGAEIQLRQQRDPDAGSTEPS